MTGIRHAIQTAIEEKKSNGSIVEAITAEDIGKLPDTSIAESISRLPGLTSQRAERPCVGDQPARHRPRIHERTTQRP